MIVSRRAERKPTEVGGFSAWLSRKPTRRSDVGVLVASPQSKNLLQKPVDGIV